MGAVYRGEQLILQRPIAVKVLHAHFQRDAEIVERFRREAFAATAIGSEHIVDVFDLGELPDGSVFMVMELLDGETLAARLRRTGPM